MYLCDHMVAVNDMEVVACIAALALDCQTHLRQLRDNVSLCARTASFARCRRFLLCAPFRPLNIPTSPCSRRSGSIDAGSCQSRKHI